MTSAKRTRPCTIVRIMVGLTIASTVCGTPACSNDMQEQISYQPEEAPRKHSPTGSVPRESRAIVLELLPKSEARLEKGARLFRINCVHCHGAEGDGDGPVAGYLKDLPANLRSAEVQSKPEAEIYDIVTRGREHLMPAFKGFLSAQERWAVAYYVKALNAH